MLRDQASRFLEGIQRIVLLGIQGQGRNQRVGDDGQVISVGGGVLVQIRLVLEGIQIDLAGIERFIGQVVGIEFDQLNVDTGVLIVEHLLHSLPLIVVRAADADGHDGLACLFGFVFHNGLRFFPGQGDVGIIIKGGEEGFGVVHQQEFSHQLGLIRVRNDLVRIIMQACAIWIVFAMFLPPFG